MAPDRPFIVVSGLPGSGKSSLARQLAPLLNLTVIDKDDILERLFESKGIGDQAWRRDLSRESDLIFRKLASDSRGGLLVSFWRVAGMPLDSGTPTDWLSELSTRILNLHCICPPEVAAERFLRRERHPGHLDSQRSPAALLESLRWLGTLPPPDVGHRLEVDVSVDPDLDSVAGDLALWLGYSFPGIGHRC